MMTKRKGPGACGAGNSKKNSTFSSDAPYTPKAETYETDSDGPPLDAIRFLQRLDPDATSFTFQTFDDNSDRKDPHLARVLHGTLAKHHKALKRLNDLGAGVFVVVNETDGQGRTRDNIVRIRALCVDLDGSPLDPVMQSTLPPHVVIETSPARFHAYWITNGVALDDFSDMQKWLADRFDGDPAVHDLPRVMRLPGFQHCKGAPHRVQITHVDPREPYAAAEFAFQRDGAQHPPEAEGPSNLPPPDLAEVRAALGAIDPDITYEDWFRIGCALRKTFGDAGFALWDEWSQGGQKYEGKRIRDQWREIGKHNYNHNIATVFYLATQANPCWRATITVSREDFRAYMPLHNYIYMPTREPWPAASVNARLGPIKVDGTDKSVPAALWLDRNQAVEQMTWAPGLPMLIRGQLIAEGGWIEKAGATCLNLYRAPSILPGDATKAGPWLDHVARVFGDDAPHIIKWLAHRVQKPDEKINHALWLGGAQGIGKDTMLAPVKRAVGPWNFLEVSPPQVLGRFNGFLKAVILRVSEVRDLGSETNRFVFYEHMKVYAAEPPDVLRVDEKYIREHYVLNCCGIIFTTNKKDSFYLPPDDRRTFVAWSDRTKEDFSAAYWHSLWRYYEEGGYGHVAAYLANLDLSDFDPKAPPPQTEAFWEIVGINQQSEESELADVLDGLGNPAAVTISDITKEAQFDFYDWLTDRKNRRSIPHRLQDCGYVSVRNRHRKDGRWIVGDVRQVVYAKVELSIPDRYRASEALVKARNAGAASGGPKASKD